MRYFNVLNSLHFGPFWFQDLRSIFLHALMAELLGYRLTNETWPCFSVTMTCPGYATVHMYTGQVALYKVPETHCHV